MLGISSNIVVNNQDGSFPSYPHKNHQVLQVTSSTSRLDDLRRRRMGWQEKNGGTFEP